MEVQPLRLFNLLENFCVACAHRSDIWALRMTVKWQGLSKSNGPCKVGPVHQCRFQRQRWLAMWICDSLIKGLWGVHWQSGPK